MGDVTGLSRSLLPERGVLEDENKQKGPREEDVPLPAFDKLAPSNVGTRPHFPTDVPSRQHTALQWDQWIWSACNYMLDCSNTVVYTLFSTGACGKKTERTWFHWGGNSQAHQEENS